MHNPLEGLCNCLCGEILHDPKKVQHSSQENDKVRAVAAEGLCFCNCREWCHATGNLPIDQSKLEGMKSQLWLRSDERRTDCCDVVFGCYMAGLVSTMAYVFFQYGPFAFRMF